LPDYYYAEFYFDPAEHAFQDIVEGCVSAVINAGCTFDMVVMPKATVSSTTSGGEFEAIGLENLKAVVSSYTEEMLKSGNTIISFPPRWGRIMFECDFAIDNDLIDEVLDEEEESRANSKSLGLSFVLVAAGEKGGKVKANLSFWEEFILTYGKKETNISNMRRILDIIRHMCGTVPPYFGAMNSELHINTDRSLQLLSSNNPPVGNEFVLVGERLLDKLNLDVLGKPGLNWSRLNEAVIIQFVDKWGGASAL
jgi:hypothetical protein